MTLQRAHRICELLDRVAQNVLDVRRFVIELNAGIQSTNGSGRLAMALTLP